MRKEIWISYKCFHNLPTSSNWNFIRKNRENRKKLKPKKKGILKSRKKLGESQKCSLWICQNVLKSHMRFHSPSSVIYLTLAQQTGALSTGTKSLMPQVTRRQKPYSTLWGIFSALLPTLNTTPYLLTPTSLLCSPPTSANKTRFLGGEPYWAMAFCSLRT